MLFRIERLFLFLGLFFSCGENSLFIAAYALVRVQTLQHKFGG